MVTCLIDDPVLKYELLSFCSIILLPLALTIRLAIDEHIFQKWRSRFESRMRSMENRFGDIEVWVKMLVAAERERERRKK